jgi:pimeloyl-ACP methyl ester carboxylesterase
MYSWRHQLAPVAATGFRVIALDTRGFGFSDKPGHGYTNTDYAHLVLTLMDSLRAPDAVLVGHSMGGAIAAEVALAAPGRVRGLVLIDAAGFGTRWPFVLRIAHWPLLGRVAMGLRGRGMTARILRSTYADPSKVTAADVDQYYAPVAEPDYGRAVRGVLREFRFDALPGRLGAVQAPTLVLWGEADTWIPPRIGRLLAAGLPRVAFFTVPRAGHAAPEEQPESVNRSLIAFLQQGLPRIPENLAWSPRSSP